MKLRHLSLSAREDLAPMGIGCDEVHVWSIGLNAFDPEYTHLLSAEERTQALRRVAAGTRTRFVQRRTARRLVLAAYTHIGPQHLAFVPDSGGKPRLMGAPPWNSARPTRTRSR